MAIRDRWFRRSRWYLGRRKGAAVVAPAARAALPTRKSRRVRLTAPPQMPLTHAADQVRGRPVQACLCPRCLGDREEQQTSCKEKQSADGVRREQELPRRDSKAPKGLE